MLDLLDLILGAEIEGLAGTEARIATIDYLITLLCTSGSEDGAPPQDPVTLTPRLNELCEQSNVEYDTRLPEIEAAFFVAADMYEADVRDELSQRTLRDRKTELGTSYFSPRILRAIVTYNAALLRRIDEQVSESRDWGPLGSSPEKVEGPIEVCQGSVFEAPVVREIASAVRRRLAGKVASMSDVDRIAWCLDLAYPDTVERKALLGEHVGLAEDPKGTAILVGLLCRSAVVLDDELPAIGISPARLSSEWVKELDDALKQDVNHLLAGDDYKEACLLSELKSKFLYAPMAEVHRKNRGRTSPAEEVDHDDRAEKVAANLARAALEDDAEGAPLGELFDWRQWPWARLARSAGVSLLACLVVLTIARVVIPDAGLTRFGKQELAQVSPYLSRGSRDLDGSGPSFVGTIDTAWLELGKEERLEAAAHLVAVLQAQGFTQIMVYDRDRGLRIQALGRGPVQVLMP